MRHAAVVFLLSIFALVPPSAPAQVPQGTAFTYQGVLKQSGTLMNGSTNMVFDLFDAAVAGNHIGPTLSFTTATSNAVNVQNGIFNVTLDFGAAPFITLVSDQRFLQVTVNGAVLTPRTQIQNTPFGLQSQTAEMAYSVSNASIGSAQVVASQVQLRVSGSCTGGATVASVNQDGSVNCAFGSGTGTITGVTAGNGLSGGGTNGSVSLGISNPLSLSGTAAGGVAAIQNTAANGIAVQAAGTGATSIGVRGQSDTGTGVRGEASSTSSATANGVYGVSQSSAGSGVVGVDYADYGVYGAGGPAGVYGTGTYGVQGFSSVLSGAGVWGSSSAGGARGVYGESTADNGAGVEGFTSGAQGEGVEGIDANGYGVVGTGVTGLYGSGTTYGTFARGPTGVRGESTDGSGFGVYGYNSSATGNAIGVEGISDSSNGYGVYGYNSSASGDYASGVVGIGNSPTGYGLYGYNSSPTGAAIGVGAYNNSSNGYALYGYNSSHALSYNAIGVAGVVDSPEGYGIYGRSTAPLGNAGMFVGNVYVTASLDVSGDLTVNGNVSKGSGSFKIDHPLDPANEYLYHSFVESPDMKDVYDGVATLDARGEAWVELPDYFEALNRDFRYQLTALDQAAPSLHVASRIAGNRFRIAGGMPGQEISWMVTGTRHDAYANAHRIQVEVPKLDKERGKYLHPDSFGEPEEKAIGRRQLPVLPPGKPQ